MQCEAKVPGLTEADMIRLMDTYSDMLYGLCRSMLNDAHMAYDVVQETFIKVWKQRDFSPRSEKAWLIRVAVNLCHDYHRSRWFLHTDRRTTIDVIPLAAVDDADREILDMVQRLPMKEKEVVLLFFWNNMNADEIAATLHISRSMVYRRLDKAKKELRLELEGGSNS